MATGKEPMPSKRRISVAGLLALGVLLALVPIAAAVSGSAYPAGHTFRIDSQPILLIDDGAGHTCTITGGVARVPAAPGNSNPIGAVSLPFTTLPSISGCTPAATVTTSGSWTLNVAWAFPAATASLAIPSGGLTWQESGCTGSTNTRAVSTSGGNWQNGFSTPVLVASRLSLGSSNLPMTGGCSRQLSLIHAQANPLTATDTTAPGSAIVVGP